MAKAPATMRVVVNVGPLDVHGRSEPTSMDLPPREVYLKVGKGEEERLPPGLERIVLAGLDSLGEDCLDAVEVEMRRGRAR